MSEKAERPDIKIGTRLWRKHHSSPLTVVGETSRSWLVRFDGQMTWQESAKIPKCKLPEGWTLDEQEWLDQMFADKHQYKIANAVINIDPVTLRKIADLIGWKPEEEKR